MSIFGVRVPANTSKSPIGLRTIWYPNTANTKHTEIAKETHFMSPFLTSSLGLQSYTKYAINGCMHDEKLSYTSNSSKYWNRIQNKRSETRVLIIRNTIKYERSTYCTLLSWNNRISYILHLSWVPRRLRMSVVHRKEWPLRLYKHDLYANTVRTLCMLWGGGVVEL